MLILSGSGILGYGYDPATLKTARQGPPLGLVAIDGGSTDGGPYYLGSNDTLCSEAAVRRDLAGLLELARAHDAPLVVGTCGGAGTDAQVEWTWRILRDVARALGDRLRVALVRSEVDRDVVRDALGRGRVHPLDGAPPLDEDVLDGAARVVAMMGVEPIAEALARGADVVLAGRCSDAAVFAALPIAQGLDAGAAWLAGKLLECGATCADPPGPDAVVAALDGGDVVLSYPGTARRCTVTSVGQMLLHETGDIFLHRESNGTLDLTRIGLSEDAAGHVRLTGAAFREHGPRTVRLEGVVARGHRKVVLGATRDPRLLAGLDDYLATVEARAHDKIAAMGMSRADYALHLSVYGRDGVLGEREAAPGSPHEVAVCAEVVAATPESAQAAAAAFRSLLLHTDFPERQCTEGNFALPFSPAELDGGPVFEFAIWHALEVDDPLTLFPIEIRETG